MKIRRLVAGAWVLSLALLVPIIAGAAPPDTPPEDRIILELATEGWVETETAEVTVAVNATLKGEEAAGVRKSILTTLEKLASDTEWRIVTFDRAAAQSGLDNWYIEAQTRLPDAALDRLRERARQASKPGLQIDVRNIDFSPTLAEEEATRARLRREIYALAREEMARANEAFSDKTYRIGLINFTSQPVPVAKLARDHRAEIQVAAPRQVTVEDRIRLNATVVLTAATATE